MKLRNFINMDGRKDYTPLVEEQKPSVPEKVLKVGEDFCQACGSERMEFIGGGGYDIENFRCKDCGIIHLMRVEYRKGVRYDSIFESFI